MNKIYKVFVTGADGMLGASICRELIKQGFQVKGLVLPGRKLNVLDGYNIEIAEGNILNKADLEQHMADCDFLIHSAALTTVWPRRSELVMAVNFEGTKNVMETAQKYQLKRMIYIGSASSFHHGSKEKPGDEKTSFKEWKYGMDYIKSKFLAQQMLLKKFTLEGFPVVVINPTYMIGPFDSTPSSGQMLIELLSDRLPGYSTGGKNFVCSIDVAKACVNALKFGRLGECYIVGNENLEYGEFLRKACEVSNKKFKLIKVPGFIILFIGFINSIIARILKKPPKISYSMARIARVGQYFSSLKAQRELNISLTPIEKGIDQCVKWFESNGYLK